jgi:hypothetical protein
MGCAGLVWLTYSELDASFFCRIAENGLYLFFTDVLHIDATSEKYQKASLETLARIGTRTPKKNHGSCLALLTTSFS